MGRPKKWESNAEKQQAYRKRHPYSRLPVFVGIDGEGTGRGSDHEYVLLSVGAVSTDAGGNPLGFTEIMDSLYSHYRGNPGVVYVGFFLGYDFARWLRLLPEDKARRLFSPELRQRKPYKRVDKLTGEVTYEDSRLGPWPVTWKGWEFDLLGMRRFKLRPEGEKSWMFVCDAGAFFQTSLMKAIDPGEWSEPVVSAEEYAVLEGGKARRDIAVLDDDMVRYNTLENEVLGRLMGRLDQGLRKAGIVLGKDQWFGPGQAAQAWLENNNCPEREMVHKAVTRDRSLPDLLDLGRQAYYGGWFEIFAHGHIPGDSWEYDINSAYPAIIAELPCLLHGKWVRDDSPIIASARDSRIADGTLAGNHYRIVKAGVVGSDPVCGAMLHRRADHSILRPQSTKGWYWEHEIASAMRCGVIDRCSVDRGYRYLPCDCPRPLRGVSGLYDERLKVGKDTPEGKAYKLVYNSMYGKFAQNIGHPKFNNYLYASMITAGCRAMILDAIATHPGGTNALLMVATDGVYFSSRHPALPISDKLGDWSEKIKANLTLFKPGVYWDDYNRNRIRIGHDPQFKARGINAKEFARHIELVDNLFRQFGNHGVVSWPSVDFTTTFSMVTCKQALQRGRWETAGTISSLSVTQNADPENKRFGPPKYSGNIWRTAPYPEMEPLESTPYREGEAGLDHEQYGITDDGTVEDSWRI